MDDNDELVALRGSGRYFGTEDQQKVEEFLCHKCHEPGHAANECKTLICNTCGKKNQHMTKDCPERSRCLICAQYGHLRASCPSRKKAKDPCTKCGSRIHIELTCPRIWRRYEFKKDSGERYPRNISCYNCGDASHYGDDCPLPRPVQLKFREDTCFSALNVDQSYRSRYYKELKRFEDICARKKKSNHYNNYNNHKRSTEKRSDKRGPRVRRGEKRDKRRGPPSNRKN